MTVRGRSRNLKFINGPDAILPAYGNAAIYLGYKGPTASESCNDETMPRPYDADHTFRVYKRDVQEPIHFSGSFKYWNTGSPVVDVSMNNHVPELYGHPAYLPFPAEPAWTYWQTKAIGNMNPTNPKIGLPLFLYEFKDFPEMLHNAGRVLSRRARASDYPGSYLAFHFGWAPLVNDLKTLFDIAHQIDNQSKFLRGLESGGKFKRTLRSGLADSSFSTTTYASLPAWPTQWLYKANVETRTYVKVWFTVNAKLAPGVTLPRSNGALRALSARQALGLTLNPAQVWDFIPWSWLIDYFGNVGDFMKANQAQINVSMSRLNIMHKTEIVVSHSGQQCVPGVSATPYTGIVTDKRRLPVSNPIPWLAPRPFLGAAQGLALENLVTARAFDLASNGGKPHRYS